MTPRPADASAGAEDLTYRRVVLRVGGVCGIAGAVVLLVANAAHPRPSSSEVGEHEAFLRLAAESDAWLMIHVAMLLAVALYVAGLAALALSLLEDRAAWLARLALVGTVVGGALSIVQHSIDTAYGQVADDWQAASGGEKETLFRIASALEDVDFTMFCVNVVLFFGLTFVLYGLAVSTSDIYPKRLGWVAVAGGLGAVVIGVVQLFTGPSVATLFVFPAFAALLSLWLLAMSVLLWRHAGSA